MSQPKLATNMLTVVVILFALGVSTAVDPRYASVFYDAKSNKLYIEEDYLEGAVAWGKFSNQVNKTGYVLYFAHETQMRIK